MKYKKLALSSILSFLVIIVFSQTPERMQTRQPSNLKVTFEAARDSYNKAVDFFDKKQYDQAISQYKMAIAIDSDYIDAYNNLGLIYYETNALDSASRYLEKSLQKFPSGTTALQNIALVEEKKGDLPKALGYYKRISELETENPEGFYNVGRVLTTMAKLDEALVQTQHAEKLYEKANSPYLSDCHYLLLVIYYNQHNKASAKKYLALCKKENVQVPSEIESGLQ
jgi:tetratricopeptide (TPR) repeat protein